MNLENTITLQLTGIGATPEEAAMNFAQAAANAITENPELLSRPYLAPPSLFPVIPMLGTDGEFAGYQRHGNVHYLRQSGDPEGWDYTVLPS